jgi:prepilin-type N-terminal cleavage/methylation domain-containing protein
MKSPFRSRSGIEHQRGFSLVELMIAMVIGLIMMTGLIQIFLANRQSYRVMEGANFMQENLRFAIDRVAQSVRMADHWANGKQNQMAGASTSGSICTADWARVVSDPVMGADGGATVPSAYLSCIASADYQPGTDVIMLRYSGPDIVYDVGSLVATQWYTQTSVANRSATMFRGLSVPAISPDVNETSSQILIMAYNAELFWVRRCSDPGADNRCGTTDDGDQPISIPTLMRSYLDSSGAWVSEPLAEGVEQFQIEYQVMNRQWRNATAVNAIANGWQIVTGARIAGVMRSAQSDQDFPADARSYNLSGDTPAFTAPASASKFLRMTYETNAVVRARVRPAPAI